MEDIEIRDRAYEGREKGKIYSDEKRKGVNSSLQPGDKVLMKQNNESKVLLETDEGVKYRRHITHVNKFEQTDSNFLIQNKAKESVLNENSVVNENVVKENQLGQSMNEIQDVGNSQDTIDNTCENANCNQQNNEKS